ncbi:MAG: putative dehydrogenase [Candidatus Promineifilaceae bacterium]|jgi:predicted dehydrogenase
MKDGKIGWGILGPGSIARKFATGLLNAGNGYLAAVGSRDGERAAAFAAEFGALHSHAGYEALLNNPEVDAIYIGTPHSFHKEHTILALRHGKHVMCEKPFAINRAQAAEMVAVAQEEKLFLMEAMWTRYLPTLVKTRQLIAEGAIGKVRMVQSDFGFRTDVNPEGRLFDPALGGGALLDVGIYPLSLASMIFGKPNRISSMANLGTTGIDEESVFVLGYEGGEMAICATAVRLNTPHEAFIMGTEGSIHIHAPWWASSKVTLKNKSGEETFDLPFKGNGYTHEAEELAHCVQAGELESAVMPLSESLDMLETMDALRQEWGLAYPME